MCGSNQCIKNIRVARRLSAMPGFIRKGSMSGTTDLSCMIMFQVCNSYFNTTTDVRWYMIYMLIPMILISLIRSLKLLAPFSSVATFLSGISFLIIFYYIFREPFSVVDRSPVGLANTIPLFFGTVLFAMEAIGVVSTKQTVIHLHRYRSQTRLIKL